LIGTRGAASARGFGLFGGTEANISPYIVRVTTSGATISSAQLFEDGSMLVLSGTSVSVADFAILAAGTHTSGTAKRLASSFTDFYQSQNSPTNTAGTLSYVTSFARVDKTNSPIQTNDSVNSYGWGGSSGTASSYVSSTGDTYLVSGLFATATATGGTPHIRQISSSGTLSANRNFSTQSTYDDTIVPLSCSADLSNVYVTAANYNTSVPTIWRLPTNLSSALPYVPLGFVGTTGYITNVAIDPSGNIYFAARDNTNGGTTLFKYSAAFGSKLAAVCLPGVSIYDTAQSSVAIDPLNGEVYWLIGTNTSVAQIIKTNSSLIPQFARQIAISFVTASGWADLQVLGNAIAFRNRDSGCAFVLPKNGSKTGTYSISPATFTYTTVSLPSYSSVSSDWTSTSGFSTTRSFTVSTPSTSSQPALSVASLNL
jgi:hypothetical protein